jgi:hypothetical protein
MRTRTAFESDAECRTQMHLARQATITLEMERVAEREHLAPELICDEVARGRMIIPANVHHAALDPMARPRGLDAWRLTALSRHRCRLGGDKPGLRTGAIGLPPWRQIGSPPDERCGRAREGP